MDDLKNLYEKRYSGSMRFQTSRPGVHSVILESIENLLPKTQVLDVGCGAGRLSLMCARVANQVHGVDISEKAISLAQLVVEACQIENATFKVQGVDNLDEGQYDIILLSEVIEHLPDPIDMLSSLYERLVKDGVLVVSCPCCLNFRGYIWMLLQEMFNLLMSPSDVRQVYPHHMREWAEKTGFTIEREVGIYYEWAWTEEAVNDMKKRIRLAIRDKRTEEAAWSSIQTHFEAMDIFLESQVRYHRKLLEYWTKEGLLRLSRDWSVPVVAPEVCGDDGDLLIEMQNYMKDRRIYFSDQPPSNVMGAGMVYLLHKI